MVQTNYKLNQRPHQSPHLPIFKGYGRRGNDRKGNHREKIPSAIAWAKYWRRVRKCWVRFMWDWIQVEITDRWEGSHGWPWLFGEDNEGHYFYFTYGDRNRMAYLSKSGELYQYDWD